MCKIFKQITPKTLHFGVHEKEMQFLKKFGNPHSFNYLILNH